MSFNLGRSSSLLIFKSVMRVVFMIMSEPPLGIDAECSLTDRNVTAEGKKFLDKYYDE